MSSEEKKQDGSAYPNVIIEGHEYDGIQEYDNPMPGWWLWIFYATIAWSVFYVAALGVGWIDDYDAQLEKGMAHVEALRAQAEADFVPLDEAFLLAAVGDTEAIARGEGAFGANGCAACHGQGGTGGIGPAFNDGTFVHGDSPAEIYTSIRDGIPAGGMPPHARLDDDVLADIVAYILSL